MATLTGTRFRDGETLRDPNGLTWRYDIYGRVWNASRYGSQHVIMEGTGHCEGRWVVVTDGRQHDGSHVTLEQARASVSDNGSSSLRRELDDLRERKASVEQRRVRANRSANTASERISRARRELNVAERDLRTANADQAAARSERDQLDRQIRGVERELNYAY